MNRHFILFAIVFAAVSSGVAKTFDIDISTGRPAASNEAYYHGETIEFRAVRGNLPVTNVTYSSVLFTTNSPAEIAAKTAAWWRTDGVVFHPTNDVGAASYRFFLEGRDEIGRDWHANGLLRLLDSPGFTPNEIELPVASLDFAKLDVANAPYYTKTEIDETIAAIPAPDLSGYTSHEQTTNAARAVAAPLEENVGVLWRYVLGDTVWFAVTNYMRTVSGAVPSLQLWEVRNGATNLVYHSTEEVSNFVASATAGLRAEITNAMPSKAWSRYQSATGAENPQPGEITIVSTPAIMMTGGGEWNRYVHTGGSSVWVLRSSGPASFGGDAKGAFFSVKDDEGVAQFEIRRTDSYEIDALPSATGFDGEDFQITYNLPAAGDHPTLYATTNLATVAFSPEIDGQIDSLGVTVSWAASGGLWRATVVQDVKAPQLFVHAKAVQEGSVVVRNNAPTALSGGIYIGNTKYTVGTATISGHTVLTLTPAP